MIADKPGSSGYHYGVVLKIHAFTDFCISAYFLFWLYRNIKLSDVAWALHCYIFRLAARACIPPCGAHFARSTHTDQSSPGLGRGRLDTEFFLRDPPSHMAMARQACGGKSAQSLRDKIKHICLKGMHVFFPADIVGRKLPTSLRLVSTLTVRSYSILVPLKGQLEASFKFIFSFESQVRHRPVGVGK